MNTWYRKWNWVLPVGLGCALICRVGSLNAQDPFGGDTEPGGAASTARADGNAGNVSGADAALDPNERSAVIRSLRQNPPRTAAELARAIELTARIQRWDQVQFWLDRADQMGINEKSAMEMVQAAGSHTFLELQTKAVDLNDAQRTTVQKILSLATGSNQDASKLRTHVIALLSANKKQRVEGFIAIQSAGSRGIQALIDYLLSEQASAPNSTMAEAFSLLGKQALAAWQAAMLTGDAAARGRLAMLAATAGESSLALDLCVVANDPNVDESVRQALANMVASRNKKIPDGPRTFRYVMDQLQGKLRDYQRIRRNDEADAFQTWQLASDQHHVVEMPAREADIVWNRIVQLAQGALKISSSADLDSALAAAIVLQSKSSTKLQQISFEEALPLTPIGMRDSYEFGCLVWDAAVQADLSSAQYSAVQNLGRWATPKTMPNAVRDRLVAACAAGFGPVRYAAAMNLLQSMYATSNTGVTTFQDQSFDGRNRLERILAEMRKLEGSPLVLVVGGSRDLRTHTRGLLESFSMRVVEAASASQAMAEIRDGSPLEGVFVVERVLEMNLGQLVQRIRANPTTSACPIALLAASLSTSEHEAAANDPRIVMGSVPPEQVVFADILRRMKIVSQAPAVDPSDRILWKDRSETYWKDLQSLWISTQIKSDFAVNVETPAGQRHLLGIVADSNQPMPKREQASRIFVQSVKQFGLHVSSETANAQYDDYNTRGPFDRDLCVVLGRVLDAIEASKGQKAWSEIAP
jgi:CheY-like chemotaxis protein